ncbi:type II secretion system F family protein [Erwinia sp.]|uniref:type II secretion system F family protein n=1 Tax=Erwinia citreus TaxID=558 RepID=UPI003C790C94
MAYLMVLVGAGLLTVHLYQWRKLTRSMSQNNTPQRAFPPILYLRARCNEWHHYALGDRSLKGMKGALVSLSLLLALLFLNANWLGFSLIFFLPVILFLLFIFQLRLGRSAQRRYFEDSFPEVLSVINAAVSAGNSIHQALHRCGESISGPLGETFKRIDRRLSVGEEPERVFSDACKSYPYNEFYFFMVVMLVSLQHGGQLRMLIGRLIRIITNSKNMTRRKLAMTSEARSSVKIVAAIPLLFFCGMKYFSPENFDFIFNDPAGQLILYYVLASETLGIGIIWMLLRRAL